MTLKALLFDAGDVLYHRPGRRAALAAFLEERGLKPLPADDPKAMVLKRRAHSGEITRDEYFDAILDLCGLRERSQYPEGRRVMDAAQIDVEFFAGVPETLNRLKQAGIRLGVVTNTHDSTESKRQWFSKVGIDNLWDSFATSCELHLCKPEPGIYLAALAPLDLYPEDAAFVGHAAAELAGAKSLGMTTVAFNGDNESVTGDHVISEFSDLLDVVQVRA
jgi:HAD superfamily hydrolase (TIGR01509 family)